MRSTLSVTMFFLCITASNSLFAQAVAVDGSSPEAFESSMASMASTILPEDKEAFDKGFRAIFAERYMNLKNGNADAGIAAMEGVTKDEILAAGRGVLSGKVDSAESYTELGWQYSDHKDDMTGDMINSAYLASSKPFEFAAPYSGEQYAILTVRHRRDELDVMLRIEKGQFACAIADCEIKVRFDDGPIQTVGVSSPTDMDSTVRFVRNPEPFLRAMRKSHSVRIEAVFFNEGSRVFEFRTEGLRE